MKAFRSIRRGVTETVQPIAAGTDAGDVPLMYIPFGLLNQHCDALCLFGDDMHVLRKIARGRQPV